MKRNMIVGGLLLLVMVSVAVLVAQAPLRMRVPLLASGV
jgi:hypothetical protein